ncbi:MAG TPA: PHB depolymerase family esterase [Gemmatimonadaceae bacterium]
MRLQTPRLHLPRRRRRPLWALAVTLLLVTCLGRGIEPPATVVETPGTRQYRVEAGELMRTFLLHIPPSRPRRFGLATSYPVVIVLHGSGANGATMPELTGMNAIADSAHFLVAYPDATTGALGLGADWNAGECCGAAHDGKVDDVGFLRVLVRALAREMPVDRRRVYVAGFSDGARMAYHAACELDAQVAAVAVVAGSIVDGQCAPRRPVPLIAFHGTADDEVPYRDSSFATAAGRPPRGTWALPPSIRFWATIDHCASARTTSVASHVQVTRFAGCAADVVLYTIQGGGHDWPRASLDSDDPAHEVDASRRAWRFFARHPLP